jgi:hypothetical protein
MKCDVCQRSSLKSELKIVQDLDEFWCTGCRVHGYLVGDQEFCEPADICNNCEHWYSKNGIKHIDDDTGVVTCVDCFEEDDSVIQT